jgi:hypothetical protein
MILDPAHPALAGDSMQFWRDELANSKILLYEIDRAIQYLSANRLGRYTIDTGQDMQTVQYHDIGALHTQRENLIRRIYKIETYLGIHGGQQYQVVPLW